MFKQTGGLIMIGVLAFSSVQDNCHAQVRERSEVAEQDIWNLKDLYPSVEAWNEAKVQWLAQLDCIFQYKGKLATSSKDLLACLELDSRLSKDLRRLYCYASMKSDADTRDANTMAMKQELSQFATNYNTRIAFVEPELVDLDKETIEQFIQEEPDLKMFRFYLLDVLRRKIHKLSEKEEKIIAEAGLMSGGPASIYNIFANAELPFPEVTLSTGEKVLLNQAGYGRYRALPNREDRELVFQEFWKTMAKFKQTIGVTLYSNVKKDIFYAHVRNYESALESALDVNNIPTVVYKTLIENVHQNLDAFHRYLKIKKQMLDVDTLKYSDIYAPTVKDVDLAYTYDESKDLMLKALAPLGKEYLGVVQSALDDRWIDVYPTPGKRSGAYSNGSAFDVHPYILLNYNGQYNDVSTLAHELGHTVHSYLSNKNQPYPLSDYSIFVAEVASTFNEALLMDYVLKEISDDDVRLSLLMAYLDNLKGTVFRQVQFAEFELRIHEEAEQDKPLTGDRLTEIYADILKTYYGHEQGITHIEDYVTVEWAFIPHFYYNFYVYQYATSFTASTALAERVIHQEDGALDKVLTFLSAGGSAYPIEILKKAGVDMTTSEPFEKTMEAMNRTMDEIEKIIN